MDVKLPPKQSYVGSNPIERTSGYHSRDAVLTVSATADLYGSHAQPSNLLVDLGSNRRRD